jgi:hypothetical protein
VYYGTTDGTFLGDRPVIGGRPNFIVNDAASPFFTFGSRLAGVGDVNGDGIGDWVAGDIGDGSAPLVHLFFGSDSIDESDSPFSRALTADVTFTLPAAAIGIPSAVAALGDLEEDGYDDFAIGHGNAAVTGNVGRIYVIHGRETWTSPIALSDSLTPPDTALIPSATFGTRFGLEVSGADVNGDGGTDLVAKGNQNIVVFLNTAGEFSGGGSYRLAGNHGTGLTRTGLAVGDLNGDGRADLVLSATAGAWVYLGDDRVTGNRATPDIRYEIAGIGGYLIGQIGDADGDGFDDIAFTDRLRESLHLRFGP